MSTTYGNLLSALDQVENAVTPVYNVSDEMRTRSAPDDSPSRADFPVLKSIDLFAGIGGIRLAFQQAGLQNVFSSEWDKFARLTYRENFGETPAGDLRKILSRDIPTHDVLTAGFPCQPFSISGVSKKGSLGKPHGFSDPTQDTLFFEVKRIHSRKTVLSIFPVNIKQPVSVGPTPFATIEKAPVCRAVTGHAKS